MATEEETYRGGIKAQLDRIETQTTKTNGRVTRLERIILCAASAAIMYAAIKSPEWLPVIAHVLV